jgi:mannosyl-3-phosphoglycerate phosphatase family protein
LANAVHLVVTDLDGSLLDHDDYGCEAARPALQLLEELRIPVVFASSKTRAEILALRDELGNEHPFIVENGAAVLLPEAYFPRPPKGLELHEGFLRREFAPRRERWTALLEGLRAGMPGSFQDFATAGLEGIVAMTGLSPEKAALANEREYSEPVQWRGSDADLARFLADLEAAGARALRGGRFISVAGDCDKGQAWSWLRQQYALAAGGAPIYDLALGDGQNDVPMLEVSDRAARIPARDRPLPELARSSGVLSPRGFGPEAWAEAVRAWLRELYTERGADS